VVEDQTQRADTLSATEVQDLEAVEGSMRTDPLGDNARDNFEAAAETFLVC
jgi:hypothetical protein